MNWHRHFRGWQRCAWLALASASMLCAQKPTGVVEGGELARELDAVLMAPGTPFWGSALFAQKGKVLFAKGYGLQDHQRVAMGPHSIVDIGGLARIFTVAVALQLQAQAKWTLDDGVGRVLGAVPKDKTTVTLRQLARHTSGLPAEVAFAGGAADARRTAVDAILAATLVDVPGRAMHASPRNDNLLAAAIELASGDNFEVAVQKRLITPLGLRDTGFVRDAKLDEKRMTWRRAAGEAKPRIVSEGGLDWAARGAMSMLSSPYDLQALVQWLWTDKACARDQDLVFAPFQGGDLFRIRPADFGGVAFLELHGAASGYRTRLVVHRASQSVLVLCGGEVELDPIEARLCGVLARTLTAPADAGAAAGGAKLPQAGPASPTATARALPTDAERFLGVFALPTGGSFAIRKVGDAALVVSGVGLQASARLQSGRWPPPGKPEELARLEDRGLSLLEALLQAKPDAFSAFAGDDAAVAAKQLWDGLRPRLASAPALAYVGTEASAPRASWFRLKGKEGAILLRAVWTADGRFQALAEAKEPTPFRAEFRLVRRDLAVATIGGGTVSITVEGEGASRVLVWEDASSGELGLVECRWTGDAR